MIKFNTLFVLFASMLLISCHQTPPTEETKEEEKVPMETASLLSDNAKVHVVYFHGKQRCKSCVSIQKIAEETIKEAYANVSEVQFVEIDFSKKENESIADKYEVAWSSLFIIAGDQFTNLTEDAFTHALSNPAMLKNLIIEQTQHYLTL